MLHWETTSEINFDHFEIERSRDGKNWFHIHDIFPDTNGKLADTYTFTDKTPFVGTNYYRLKMLDMDGSFAYSSMHHVNFENIQIIAYPNPVKVDSKLQLLIGDKRISNITIYNQTGSQVYFSEMETSDIDIMNLPSGQYVIKIVFKDKSEGSCLFVKE